VEQVSYIFLRSWLILDIYFIFYYVRVDYLSWLDGILLASDRATAFSQLLRRYASSLQPHTICTSPVGWLEQCVVLTTYYRYALPFELSLGCELFHAPATFQNIGTSSGQTGARGRAPGVPTKILYRSLRRISCLPNFEFLGMTNFQLRTVPSHSGPTKEVRKILLRSMSTNLINKQCRY
jgi:hypothetical protein